jgi:hypothetical protein
VVGRTKQGQEAWAAVDRLDSRIDQPAPPTGGFETEVGRREGEVFIKHEKDQVRR